MEWEDLRETLIEKYYPEEEEIERINQKYVEISEFIQREFGMETHFAGSASRETCMTGDKDIDIFVLFPEDTDRQELEDKGLEIGKAVFEEFNGNYNIEYAEHPYTKGEIGSHEVEIVPCIDTDPENIRSSVDRTPHHSRWVEKNLDEDQRKDVVILKKFLKAEGIYGSSLKTEGFSGYVCEALIAHYGSFQELVREAVKWQEQQVIDPENHHKGELHEKLRQKFENEHLVLIDPVDPERNTASVLNKENYCKFILLCWKFRKEPDLRFFEEWEEEFTEFQVNQELKKRKDFLVLEFENVDEVDDIVYPQMRKALRRLEKHLEEKDFRVYNSGFHIGERTRIFFELDQKLPKIKEMEGPKPFHGEDHVAQFSSKYENVYVKEDRLVAKTEREFRDAKNLLQNFLSGDLRQKGIPEQVAERMKEFSFGEPVTDDREWLNYLGEKLHIQNN